MTCLDNIKRIQDYLDEHGLKYETHLRGEDGEFDYLGEEEGCIVIINPGNNQRIYIDVSYDDYTLAFGGAHVHYDWDEEKNHENLMEDLIPLLESTLGAATLLLGGKEWYGAGFHSKEDILNGKANELFSDVLEIKEFAREIADKGGIVECRFWDALFGRTMQIGTELVKAGLSAEKCTREH